MMITKKFSPSRFILKGFSHDQSFRQFVFEGLDEDHVRARFMVRADLTLSRTYGIHIQDLPLLCRELLEQRAVTEETHRFTLTEEDMRRHQADRLAVQSAAAQKGRPTRRPSSGNTGNAWRTTPMTIQSGA
jgi:hypothetical protein